MSLLISPNIRDLIIRILLSSTGKEHRVLSEISIGGGSINKAYKVQTDKGVFFVKVNDAKKFPGMFEAEAKGLEILRKKNKIYVPAVIGTGEEGNETVFVSEFVESGKRSKHFFHEFGQALAKLHACGQVLRPDHTFGLDHDNYIGSLKQFNAPKNTWSEFFSEMRLEVQVKLARDKGALDREHIRSFENLYLRLDEIFPDEDPSLLHGDLWSGNFMTGPDGKACIFDPAVYYGHREMDIAMSKLFGGFDREFYEGYDSVHPPEKGWEKRIEICNLYPLLVHVNLFGGGYVNDVSRIILKFR